jgi:hypothetical protein
MAFALARHSALRPSRHIATTSLRSFLSTKVDVDYDHYTEGWQNIADLADFTHGKKYCVQTFNKISPQASPEN